MPDSTSKFQPIIRSKEASEALVPANLDFVPQVTTDGQVMTILLVNLYVSTDFVRKVMSGPVNQSAIKTKVVTFNIPYSTDQKTVKMRLDLAGFSNAGPGAKVRLVACAGDTTKEVNLVPANGQVLVLKGTSKDVNCPAEMRDTAADYFDSIPFTLEVNATKPLCQITIFLLAEQDADTEASGGAVLGVDSLTLMLLKPDK